MLLTRVVVRAFPFHRINAPVTKPDPLAVIVKPCPPALAVWGLTNVSLEEEVWMERFVLYWEQADASPHATNATISHLREHIRTRSSRATLAGTPGRQKPGAGSTLRRQSAPQRGVGDLEAAKALSDQSAC